MVQHASIDHTGLPGAGAPTEIVDIPTAETDDTLVLAPDGAGGVEFRAAGGGGFTEKGAGIYKSGDQNNLTTITEAKITFDTAEYDTDSYFDNANDRLTIPSGLGGRYLVTGGICLTGSTGASVDIHCYLKKGGTHVRSFYRGNIVSGEDGLVASFAYVIPLVATDYIEMFVNPGNVAGNVIDVRSGIWTRLEMTKIS